MTEEGLIPRVFSLSDISTSATGMMSLIGCRTLPDGPREPFSISQAVQNGGQYPLIVFGSLPGRKEITMAAYKRYQYECRAEFGFPRFYLTWAERPNQFSGIIL